MNKSELFNKLLKNVETYKPEETLSRFYKNKNNIISSCNKHFPDNKKLLQELYRDNPLIVDNKKEIHRVMNLSQYIEKDNELLKSGDVAAIDGTTKFAIDDLVFHHYFSIVIGYVTYKKNDFKMNAEHWDTSISMDDLNNKSYDDLERVEAMLTMSENRKAPKNDLMLYKEREMSLNIGANHIFLDGPIFMESLLQYEQGCELYKKMIESDKNYIGIIKDISKNSELTLAAESLEKNEARIVKDSSYKNDISAINLDLKDFYIGVFKIRNKAYGFEVHKNILKKMLILVFSDCKDFSSYEIPWLLSIIDKGIKSFNESEQMKEFLIAEIQRTNPEFLNLIKNERKLR